MRLFFFSSDNIGDAIITNEILHRLVASMPQIKVSVYIKNSTKTSSLYSENSNIDATTSISTKFIKKRFFRDVIHINRKINTIPKNEPIYITSLLGSGTLMLALTPLLWIHKLCGRNIKMFGVAKAHLGRESGNIIIDRLKLLEKNLGVKINSCEQSFLQKFIDGNPRKPNAQKTVAIVTGASKTDKILSPAKFVKIIEYFFTNGWKVQILGSDSKIDVAQGNAIMRLLPQEIVVENRIGKTTPKEYFLNVANVDYVVTNDSSAQHVAYYLNVPCMVLWGRDKSSPTVKAYAWFNERTLNFFNSQYLVCEKCKIRERFCERKSHCDDCIAKNYSNINVDAVIQQMAKHLAGIK